MKIPVATEDHPLAIAARVMDDADGQIHLPGWAETVGLKAEDLMYVAEQRALRCVLLLVRKMPLERVKNINLINIYPLSDYERHLYNMFSACEMDGLIVGWIAQQQENKQCTQTDNQKKSKSRSQKKTD